MSGNLVACTEVLGDIKASTDIDFEAPALASIVWRKEALMLRVNSIMTCKEITAVNTQRGKDISSLLMRLCKLKAGCWSPYFQLFAFPTFPDSINKTSSFLVNHRSPEAFLHLVMSTYIFWTHPSPHSTSLPAELYIACPKYIVTSDIVRHGYCSINNPVFSNSLGDAETIISELK